MISNEERRAIAARLRSNACSDWEWVVPWAVFNDAEEHDGEINNRLADLIEPEPDRTCRNVIDSRDKFVCDVCGAFVRDTHIGCSCIGPDVVKMYSTSNDHSFSYCPNCGAKVVE